MFSDMSLSTTNDGADRLFDAYTFQAHDQLGLPDQISDHLDPLLVDIDLSLADRLYGTPLYAFEPPYDGGAAMADVARFVDEEGERLLFVCGEHDPWSGGHFALGGAVDSLKLIAPGRNHNTYLIDLEPADFEAALTLLAEVPGVAAVPRFAFVPDFVAFERLRAARDAERRVRPPFMP